MTGVVHWQFHDPEVDETWTMPINPNQMSSPFPQRQVDPSPGVFGKPVVRVTGYAAREWTFGGVLRGQDMYEEMLRWFAKGRLVQLRDHFLRTWEVMPVQFDEQERRPSATEAWKYTYTARTYVTRRIS